MFHVWLTLGPWCSPWLKAFFFLNNFEPWGQEPLHSCQWLQLCAYLGYLEIDVDLCGSCGVLVVKDPPGGMPSQVPGVLGMNVISKSYQELFGQHGSSLFDLPSVSKAPSPVVQALQHYHQAGIQNIFDGGGNVQVFVEGGGLSAPGGTIKLVAATYPDLYCGSNVLFEPLDSGLPMGL